MNFFNRNKLRQLVKNAVIPAAGTGIIFWLAFGLGWWIVPVSILLGGATSFVISKPKSLELPPSEEQLALHEAQLDKNWD